MSFLDSLENNLKALESQEDRDPEKRRRDLEAREVERAAARLLSPHIELLKNGPFTQSLLSTARTLGHSLRTFIDTTWIGTTLRLDVRGRRLELRPTNEGILTVYLEDGREVRTERLDPSISAETLLKGWLECA
jgi:hypothetical protein